MNRISIIELRYNSASPIRGTIDSGWSQDYGKILFEKYGKFDLQFKLSSDFDLILRFLCVHKFRLSLSSKWL
jgi:hypothetical protein